MFGEIENSCDVYVNSDVSDTSTYDCDVFLRLFRKYVYYHFSFPKINKKGAWNKSKGVGKFFKD